MNILEGEWYRVTTNKLTNHMQIDIPPSREPAVYREAFLN